MRVYKNYLIPKNITQIKIEKGQHYLKLNMVKEKLCKYNVPATSLNCGAIHSAEFKRICLVVIKQSHIPKIYNPLNFWTSLILLRLTLMIIKSIIPKELVLYKQ